MNPLIICTLMSVTCTPIPEHKPMQMHEIRAALDMYQPDKPGPDLVILRERDLNCYDFDLSKLNVLNIK